MSDVEPDLAGIDLTETTDRDSYGFLVADSNAEKGYFTAVHKPVTHDALNEFTFLRFGHGLPLPYRNQNRSLALSRRVDC